MDRHPVSILLPAQYVNQLGNGTGIQVYLGYYSGDLVSYGGVTLRVSPCGNCGMMEMTYPYKSDLIPDDAAKKFLLWIEAFSRNHHRSVLQGNDGVDGRVWTFIKKYGTDYNFVECGYNRNYDTARPHRVGLYYKNIGEHTYLAKDFGFHADLKARPT